MAYTYPSAFSWTTRKYETFDGSSNHLFSYGQSGSSKGYIGTAIGTDNSSRALRFGRYGDPYRVARDAVTGPFQVNNNAGDFRVSFDLGYGNSYNGGENVDYGETVSLQYKFGNSSYWSTLKTVADDGRYGSHSVSALLSPTANNIGDTVQFRWVQAKNSGGSLDQWSLDNVRIEAQGDGIYATGPVTQPSPPLSGYSQTNSPGSPVTIGAGNTVTNTITNQPSFTLNSNNTTNSNNTIDNSVNNTTTQTFTINLTGNNNTLGAFDNTSFDKVGNAGNDILKSQSSTVTNDLFRGGAGNDQLTGYRGKDVLLGDAGNDILRAGNGRDVLSGGDGADILYGCFGQNIFTGEKDGAADKIFLKSDQYASNWIYGKAGNQDGNKVDLIGALDSYDRIHIQGVSTYDLTFKAVDTTVAGNKVSGIGIFAHGTLEAVYTGGDFNASQLQSMTVGVGI